MQTSLKVFFLPKKYRLPNFVFFGRGGGGSCSSLSPRPIHVLKTVSFCSVIIISGLFWVGGKKYVHRHQVIFDKRAGVFCRGMKPRGRVALQLDKTQPVRLLNLNFVSRK